MNKRIRKKREREAVLRAVAAMTVANAIKMDRLSGLVDKLVHRLEEVEDSNFYKLESFQTQLCMQSEQVRSLQLQVESLGKPWFKRIVK